MTVLLETVDNGIATLTMNRPEARNAMSGDMISAFLEALPRLGADSNVRCVVLTGAGISAESGLATFRGSDGLWEGHRIEDVATPAAWWRARPSRTCSPARCA